MPWHKEKSPMGAAILKFNALWLNMATVCEIHQAHILQKGKIIFFNPLERDKAFLQ